MRTARAGPAPRTVDMRRPAKRALPVSTIVGLQVGLLLSGAILTETCSRIRDRVVARMAIRDPNYP